MDAALKIHLMRKPIKASPREPISGWRATLIFPVIAFHILAMIKGLSA